MSYQETHQDYMKHLLIHTRRYIAIMGFVVLGLSVSGCGDKVSVSNDVQVPLSTLTVTPGTLQPGFSANTTNYTVEAETAVTGVTVKATPKDSTTTMTINGAATLAGQDRSIPLDNPGSTKTIKIILSSQTGTESTYSVNVTRLLSSDNNLKALTVTSGTLNPPFTSGTLAYTVDVGTKVTDVTVSATKSDPSAVISGNVPNEGQATIPLDGPGTSKTISITVTAPNGSGKTYNITVNRAPPSSDNNLKALTVTGGALVPGFASETVGYVLDVSAFEQAVTVSATKSDPDAVISGNVPNEGRATIPLEGPGTTKNISVTVTAPNGDSKTYTITVNRGVAR